MDSEASPRAFSSSSTVPHSLSKLFSSSEQTEQQHHQHQHHQQPPPEGAMTPMISSSPSPSTSAVSTAVAISNAASNAATTAAAQQVPHHRHNKWLDQALFSSSPQTSDSDATDASFFESPLRLSNGVADARRRSSFSTPQPSPPLSTPSSVATSPRYDELEYVAAPSLPLRHLQPYSSNACCLLLLLLLVAN